MYHNTQALPCASLIDRARSVQSDEEAWQAIHTAEFDPSKEVVIENGTELSGAENQAGDRALALASSSNERVELIARTKSPAYLVMSGVYYPGWTATIDDQPTQMYPANFAFRAVLVPPGEHHVTFTFEPATWRVGLAISALTRVGLIGYSVRSWRRRR